MNKKKVLSLCMVGALAGTAVVGGTLAYFTDTDGDVNVMTTGRVEIVQNEEQRPLDENGNPTSGDLVAFEEDKLMVPAVIDGTLAYDGEVEFEKDENTKQTHKIWDESINNEVDKIVTVSNRGTLPAYVRTLLAFEDDAKGTLTAQIHTLWGNSDGQYAEWPEDNGSWLTITVDDVTYNVAVCTYDTALQPGETSAPSLVQMFLDPTATNEWSKAVGAEYNVLVLSQAAQVDGFDDAKDALDTAFGEVTVANAETVEGWFRDMVQKTTGANNVIGGDISSETEAASN